MNLNNLLESANPWKSMQGDANRLANKWAKTGLLEGMDSEVESNNMSMILENQAKQLVTEAASTTGTGGTFTAGTGGQWAGVALPLVRKVFGQIAAKEFVSVQPMNLPSGLVFYLDFQYGTSKINGPFTSGNSLYGTTDTKNTDASGGLYNSANKWTYSTNLFSASYAAAESGSATWDMVGFDGALSASISAGSAKYFLMNTSSLTNLDTKGVRGFTLSSGSNFTVSNLFPQYTQLVPNTANVRFIFSSSAGAVNFNDGALGSVCVISWTKQPTDNARGDFEAGATAAQSQSGATISIPEINVQLRSEAIVAKTKKLKAAWTPEFAQDLNAYHSLDAEAELTSIMSEYISLEIDLEILDMLQEAANTQEQWSAENNVALQNTALGIADSNLGFYNTQGGWFQTLGTKIQKVSNKIHQKTLRGGANFLVISPDIATVIESIPGFASNSDGDATKKEFAFGIQKAGTLNGRYKVYKNPYQTSNLILMGYRGSQFLETGAVFAPYIPLIMTPLIYDPTTFTPRKGLLTRYAKKMIRPEFYGKIWVSGLNTI